MNTIQPIVLKHMNPADIRWKNFKGKVSDRNKYGTKQFVLFLDPELVDIEALVAEGWPIKTKEYAGTDKPVEYCLNVDITFGYEKYPTDVTLIITDEDGVQHGCRLDDDTIFQLDDVVFTDASCIIRPRWYKNKFTGEWKLKAMLARLDVWSNPDYFKIALDDFDNDLADVIFVDDDKIEEALEAEAEEE